MENLKEKSVVSASNFLKSKIHGTVVTSADLDYEGSLKVDSTLLEATERFHKMQTAGNYIGSYFTHGLAIQVAEATADYPYEHIRR